MFISKRAVPVGLIALAATLAVALSAGAATCTFTQNLYLGVRSSQVMCLQQYLNNIPAGTYNGQVRSATYYDVAASGAGSPGMETSYYGAKTKAAVARWQADNGVAPVAGYFGPKSQAKYASVVAGAPAAPGAPAPAPAAGGLSVAVDPTTPASRTFVAGASNAAFALLDFTAGSGDVTVTTLKLTRSGIASDAEVGNAYLYDNATGNYISQYSGLGSGVLTFTNAGGLFTVKAGTTKVVSVRLDVSSSASNNHTMAWGVNAATDVVSNATSVSGSFPVTGNAMTFVTVSNPAIATLTSTAITTGNSVNAGTTGYLAGSFTLQSANSAVYLDKIILTQNGSVISSTDVQNIKLVTTGGVQLGATLPNLNSDGTGVFNLSANPYKVPSGQTIQVNVYADVVSGVNRTLKFNVLNLRDLQARDATYNVGISMSGSVAMTSTTVQAGSLTMTLDPSSPTGNVAPGATNVTLEKVKVTAYGEQIKVLFVPFKLVMTSGGANFQSNVNNVYLVDDSGNQIGTTLSSTSISSSTGTSGTWSSGDSTAATFGTSSAPINYLIPANTTRIWSLKSDVLSGTGGTDIAGTLLAGTSNYQGQVSLSSANTTTVTGNTLTLSTKPFKGVVNSGMGAVNLVKNQTNARIGSFQLSASSAEGISVSTITFSSSSTFPFANLYIKVNGVQFGTVTGSTAVSTAYTFAGASPVTIAAGGTMIVDVYADVLSTASNSGSSFYVQLQSASATGAVTATSQTLYDSSGTAISSTNLVNGQGVTLNVSGATITLAPDASRPASYQVVMGSTQKTLGIWRFTGASTENVNIQTLAIKDKIAAVGAKSSFANLQWYQGGVAVGPAVAAGTASGTSGSESGYLYTFNFTSPISVPQNGGVSLELRGDVNSKVAGGSTSGSTHTFSFNPNGAYINALGSGSSLVATVNDSSGNGLATTTAAAVAFLTDVNGTQTDVNAVTVVRTKLTVVSDPTGITASGHIASAADVMAVFVFTADPGYDVSISTVTMKLAGSTLTTVTTTLIDADTGSAWGSSSPTRWNNAYTGTASTSASFLPAYTLTAGATKRVKVQVDTNAATSGDTAFTATTGSTNGTQAQWYIDNETGTTGTFHAITNALCWGDTDNTCSGTTATGSNTGGAFNLEAKVLPIYGPALRY